MIASTATVGISWFPTCRVRLLEAISGVDVVRGGLVATLKAQLDLGGLGKRTASRWTQQHTTRPPVTTLGQPLNTATHHTASHNARPAAEHSNTPHGQSQR